MWTFFLTFQMHYSTGFCARQLVLTLCTLIYSRSNWPVGPQIFMRYLPM
jgi:hypothetical protein